MIQVFKEIATQVTDTWEVFTDLITVFGILAVAIYFGGYVYLEEYYAQFYIWESLPEWSTQAYLVAFLNHVANENRVISILGIIIFSFSFFIVRTRYSNASGYMVLILLLISTILGCINLSEKEAEIKAKADWMKASSTLGQVNIFFSDEKDELSVPLKQESGDGELRLILLTKGYTYLIKPLQNEQDKSAKHVYVVKNDYIAGMEVKEVPGHD